ncbi:hypothetical protein NQ315_009888 [Exocentrus adspersus]|uniref:CHK kinase-like domain-containing protein n=1 Tax=Exocentrus adspersus TaxID=1586481 RepID=A0AAV8WHN4_9CUCU|nr:hypothetical protein NQ315_009888 [Exocentrus adspersus]
MSETTPADIYKILKQAVKDHIDKCKITIQPNQKGEGLLGQVLFVSLEDQTSKQVLELVVKQAFASQTIRETTPIKELFQNEIYFYANVWPRLDKFQERIQAQYQFRKVAKFIASSSDDKSEKIVLENLKFQGFQMHDKKVPLSKEQFQLMMWEYGKFHALSFAYKALYPEGYADLTKGVMDVYSNFNSTEGFRMWLKHPHEICMEILQGEVDEVVMEKYRPYLKNYVELFQNSLDCRTKYTVITHGDCWSNNMMFKYDEQRRVMDIRFIDFQMSKVGSPCCDLSYCLYSGASKEVLQDFHHYLQVYHDSLSRTLRAFGCDPDRLYPFQELKNDWKKYCKLGMLMGLSVWKLKYTDQSQIRDLTDIAEEKDNAGQSPKSDPEYDKEAFKKVSRDLILHMYENDFL